MFVSDRKSEMSGTRIVSELCKSITLASFMLCCSHVTVSRLPLHRPFEGTVFLSNNNNNNNNNNLYFKRITYLAVSQSSIWSSNINM